eukprot:TRINITY_DN38672_c0_g1_i1.p1 TRINITY_DN38672_c0_g1~~TRINITY_DN38672_c0_g1_i1.p1  ORF type:complete len:532 (-),score=62.88 TRINITY_DN38672_c0_g1_i1:1078-2673(-)
MDTPSQVLGLCLCLVALAYSSPTQKKQPNIVFAIIDDIGWKDVSYHGANYQTPTLDALAKDGVKLDNYYVQPTCSPTRSAFLTGHYPYRMGLQHLVIIAGSSQHVPKDVPMMSEVLRKHGYATHAIGKWHMGYSSFDYTPTGRGFDSHVGYYQAMEDYYTKHTCLSQPVNGTICGLDFWHNRTYTRATSKQYSTDIYRDEALKLINAHNPQQPLYMLFALQALHLPLEAPPQPKYMQACDHIKDPLRHVYCAMATAADDAIDQVIGALKAKDMWNDTILVVTTDNGGMPGLPGNDFKSAGCNMPYRAGKATIFEGGVKGLGFVHSPLIPKAARGKSVTGLMHAVDWSPTLLSTTSAPLPAGMDGINMWPAIIGANTTLGHDELVLNLDAHKIPPDDFVDRLDRELQVFLDKILGHHNPIPNPTNAIRVGDWKLIYGKPFYDGWYPEAPAKVIPPPHMNKTKLPTYLFNLATDPYEHHNLADKYPKKVQELTERMQYYHKKNYRPAQDIFPHLLGFPELHHGVWAPFQKGGN